MVWVPGIMPAYPFMRRTAPRSFVQIKAYILTGKKQIDKTLVNSTVDMCTGAYYAHLSQMLTRFIQFATVWHNITLV